MGEKQPLLGSNVPHSSQPAINPGYPHGQCYPGAAPLVYAGIPPTNSASHSGPPPQAAYAGGPPPQGAYPGGPASAMGYQGGAQPKAGYSGTPGPAGAYQPPGGPSGEEVIDNSDAAPAGPSALPLNKMDTVAGYDHVGFDTAPLLPPPSYDDAMGDDPPQRAAVTGLPQMREEEAREALLEFVAENCCYGRDAAEELKFTELRHSSAFHYTLETFGESRSTSWAYEPYRGQPIDGSINGPAPGPWDIQVSPLQMFKNQKKVIDVPHTASIKPCHNCMATGRVQCHSCYGRGRMMCTSCGGSGHTMMFRNGVHQNERCTWCQGYGTNSCIKCHGSGMVTCSCCSGQCKLKCYIKLTIQWTNHSQDHIVERTALPEYLIRSVSGQIVFEEQQPRVWPVNHFPDSAINTASKRIVSQHASAFPSEKILMQRHRVRIIPVTQALYHWKNEDSDFFVYGFEKKVHAPDYPQQCCGCCSLL